MEMLLRDENIEMSRNKSSEYILHGKTVFAIARHISFKSIFANIRIGNTQMQ